jgi:hypothetical protein
MMRLGLSVVSLLLLLATLAQADNVTVRHIPLSDVNSSGQPITSCWGGLGKDSSNRIYIAMGLGAPESTDVGIFRYTPTTGERLFLDTLKHVTQLEGNYDANETIAKVHAEMLPLGGKLYFASHDFHDVSPGYRRGGHFFSYDPATSHFEDLSKTDPGGVSAPGQGIIGMDIMLPQQQLIGFTYGPDGGGDVVAYDLATRRSAYWQGNPNPDGGVSRHIFTSHDLLAYISYGQWAGPQQIYAMDVTTGAITSPPGMTLRRAQIPAVAHASDGDRVFLLNWDWVYLFHTASKRFEDLGSLLPVDEQGVGLDAANLVLSKDETKLYAVAEGYPGGTGAYAWRLYEFDIQTRVSRRMADLTPQMMAINGGTIGAMIGARMDAQGSIYSCASEGFFLQLAIETPPVSGGGVAVPTRRRFRPLQ